MKKGRDFSAGMGFVAAIVLMLMLVICTAGLSMAEEDRAGKNPATTSMTEAAAVLKEAEKLKGEVVKLYDAGKYKEAIELADKALLLVATLGKENSDVATALHCRRKLALFCMYRDKPDYAKAKSLLSDCVRICTGRQNEAAYKEVIEKTDSTIDQLRSKRYNLNRAGKYKEAIVPAEKVLALEETLDKDHLDIVNSLDRLALLYTRTGRYGEAEPLYKRALAIYEKALGPDDLDVAISLNNLAALYFTTGRYVDAEPLYKRSLAIYEKALGPDHPDVALALNNLAGLYETTGRYAEAEPLYKRALAIREKSLGPDHPSVATSLNNLAALYFTTGRYVDAEPLYKRSLAIYEKALGPDHPDVALALNNLAVLYQNTSRYAEAEPLCKRSLAIKKKALGPDHPDVATFLNNLAELYQSTGRYAEAEPLYKRSLAIREKSLGPDHPDVATSLNNLAELYQSTGRYADAEPLYKRALAIYEKALGPDHPDVATSLNNLAALYESTGRYGEAEPLYKRSLAIYEKSLGPDHRSVAGTLNNLALLYRITGRYGEAEPLYKRSLAIAQGAGKQALLYKVQSGYSHLLEKENHPEAAIFFAKQAVNTIQGIRGNVARMDKETQKAYQGTVADVYKRLSGLLIDAGRLSEAQQVMDLLKQEEYFEFVRRDAQEASAVSGRAALTVRETDANKQYQAASVALARLSVERGALVEKGKKAPLTTDEDALLARIDTKLAAAGKAFQKTLDEITTELSRSRKEKSEQIREAQGLQEDLRELGNGAVAIYTLAGEKKFRLLLITPDFQRAYEYPITEKELNRKVSDFRAALTPRGGRLQDPLPLAQELYKIILGPAAADLQTVKAETLMWSLDGSLRYLPVAALHDGRQYLVATYRNVLFTPASQARLKDLPVASWQGLGLGVSKEHKPFSALPSVEQELTGIISAPGKKTGVLPGRMAMDETFTWEAMKGGLRQRYPLVHIASHFQFTPGNDTMSFLLLGDGKHLTLSDIKSQNNLFGGVDLLTLSACNTAVGDAGAEGKEVEGFGVLAQRQGAKAVIATLWPVADASTSLLMQEFYRQREAKPGTLKAEALRQAQLALLTGRIKGEDSEGKRGEIIGMHGASPQGSDKSAPPRTSYRIDPDAPYAHPYFWAPFILMGNWK